MLIEVIFLLVFNFVSAVEKETDVNLLLAVGSPVPRDVAPMVGPFGIRGRPAFQFTPNSYIGRYARDILHLPFQTEFGIKVTTLVYRANGGVLFSIVSKDQHKDFLTLEVRKKNSKNQTIEINYRNSNPLEIYSVKFDVPNFYGKWTIFSIAVRDQNAWLFMNGCQIVRGFAFRRRLNPLDIKEDSVVYVGRAGWYSDKRPFFVSTFTLY
eukprot:gene13358-4210_t